jgi:protein-tyrosine phosphatase
MELSERIRRAITCGVLDPHCIEPWICDRYRLFPTEELEEYRRYVCALLAPGCFPMVVHCASGKDRTGFAIAVVLLALGVPRDTILEDYMLSNLYRRSLARQLPPGTPAAVLQALSGVRASYLRAAFDALDAAWGTEDAFLSRGLGLDRTARASLQGLLLEPSQMPSSSYF